MKLNQNAINLLAEEMLRGYLVNGEVYKPGEIEAQLLGVSMGESLGACFAGDPLFNRSPFGHALKKMVDSGEVKAWRNGKGDWCYQIVPSQ